MFLFFTVIYLLGYRP